MFRRTFAIVLSVLAVAGIAAGCGGDDSEPLTKAEFIKQADAVCKDAKETKQKDFEKFTKEIEDGKKKATTSTEQELIDAVVVPALEKQSAVLGELDPPEGEEEKVEALHAELDNVLAEAKENPTGSEVSAAPFAKLQKSSNEYGFKYCGYP
jgi:hypothetical protein